MTSIVKPRRTFLPGKVPTTADLADGEIGVNVADGIIYLREGANIRVVGTAIREGVVPMGLSTLAPAFGASSRTWQITDANGQVPLITGDYFGYDTLRWGTNASKNLLAIPARILGFGEVTGGVSKFALLNAGNLTTDRTFALPDKNGLVALTEDIPSLGSDFISGFEIRTTATSIIVGPGRAVIESTGLVATSAGVTNTSTRASNTWYHLYVDALGVIWRTTTAPNPTAYYGVARSQNGNTSRRYIGSVRTTGTNYYIQHCPPSYGSGPVKVTFAQNAAVNSRIISNGASSTPADVNMSSLAPANTTYSGTFRIQNGNASAQLRYYIWTGSAFSIFSNIVGINTITVDVLTDTTPKIQYDEPSGLSGMFIDLLGYTYYR